MTSNVAIQMVCDLARFCTTMSSEEFQEAGNLFPHLLHKLQHIELELKCRCHLMLIFGLECDFSGAVDLSMSTIEKSNIVSTIFSCGP